MWARILYTNRDWIETLIRIILGVVFFAHGAQKLLGWFGGAGLKNTMLTMHQFLRLPIPLAFLAIATEFFGGVGLIVGLLSRLAALGIAATMVAAILMVHGRYGLFLNWFGDRKGHGFEYHLLAIALAAVIIARGAGALSLDRFLYTSLV
ncbi:MAG TPA: DoxX family protein [Bryobacteraceae bacterium]|jgi:putative oxidoreductase|nr:DoxX family protein [Bryobacteraceae bacterium]